MWRSVSIRGARRTKFALVDEAGELVDSFYASNNGRPLDVAQQGLVSLKNRWETAGVTLAIDAVGTTGYGEELSRRAFHADYRTWSRRSRTPAPRAHAFPMRPSCSTSADRI